MKIKIRIGPNFGNELVEAGLHPGPVSWTAEEVNILDTATPQERAAIQAVIEAHNPDKPDIKAEIVRIEQENPVTHRALREFTLMVASMFPEQAAQVSGIRRVAEIEAEIAELRKEL